MAHLWDQQVHGFQLNLFWGECSKEEAGSLVRRHLAARGLLGERLLQPLTCSRGEEEREGPPPGLLSWHLVARAEPVGPLS